MLTEKRQASNDPYVDFELNSKIFEENLGAEIIVENNKGHFSGEDKITEFPELLEKATEMLEIMGPARSRAVGEYDDYKF